MSDVDKEDGFWSWIAESVMNRPLSVLVPAVVVLLIAGSPFSSSKLENCNLQSLSPDDESRNGLELTDEYWPENVETPLKLFLKLRGVILSRKKIFVFCMISQRNIGD